MRTKKAADGRRRYSLLCVGRVREFNQKIETGAGESEEKRKIVKGVWKRRKRKRRRGRGGESFLPNCSVGDEW